MYNINLQLDGKWKVFSIKFPVPSPIAPVARVGYRIFQNQKFTTLLQRGWGWDPETVTLLLLCWQTTPHFTDSSGRVIVYVSTWSNVCVLDPDPVLEWFSVNISIPKNPIVNSPCWWCSCPMIWQYQWCDHPMIARDSNTRQTLPAVKGLSELPIFPGLWLASCDATWFLIGIKVLHRHWGDFLSWSSFLMNHN